MDFLRPKQLRANSTKWMRTAFGVISFTVLFNPIKSSAAASIEVLQALGSGFGKFSPLSMAICGVSLVAIMAFFVVFEIFRSGKDKREKVEIGWQSFNEMAAQKRLTQQETDLLKRIVETGGVSSADMVFDSSFIYEDAIENFVKINAVKLDKDESQFALMRGLRVKMGFAHLPSEIPISSSRQFEEGMVVTLTDGEGVARRGRVSEVKEKNWSVVLENDIPSSLVIDVPVEITILRSGDGEYSTQLVVQSTRVGAQLIFLPHTRALERKQLRNWVRIDVNIPCRVTVMAKPEGWRPSPPGLASPAGSVGQNGPTTGMVLEGRLMDLSGGGTCARFSSPIPQGHKLSLNFDLPGTSLRGVHSLVMRMTSVVRSSREDYEHNLKFINMETAYQEKIVRYVFEKQRIDSQLRGPIKIG